MSIVNHKNVLKSNQININKLNINIEEKYIYFESSKMHRIVARKILDLPVLDPLIPIALKSRGIIDEE